MPKVLNKRTDIIPEDAVYVGRPTKWGNPYKIDVDGDREEVIELYRHYLHIQHPDLREIEGKDLVCWCHTWDGRGENPRYCHADILLELANEETPQEHLKSVNTEPHGI